MNETGNKYALAALKEKRATFAGEILDLKKKIAWREQQLAHIDAAIQVFEPGFEVENITPKRPRKRVKLFRQGELGRLILDALRRAGKPLTTQEITTSLMTELGHDESARSALSPRVRGNLAYHERETGKIHKIGKGRTARWVIS